jgi:hypothetical protein
MISNNDRAINETKQMLASYLYIFLTALGTNKP